MCCEIDCCILYLYAMSLSNKHPKVIAKFNFADLITSAISCHALRDVFLKMDSNSKLQLIFGSKMNYIH